MTVTIDKDTKVSDSARILDNAKILGHATVKNNAQIKDNALICDYAEIRDDAIVLGDGVVQGNAFVQGYAIIEGVVKGDAWVKGGHIKRGVVVIGTLIDGIWTRSPIAIYFPRYQCGECGYRRYFVGCRDNTLEGFKEHYADPYDGSLNEGEIKDYLELLEFLERKQIQLGGVE